MKNVFARELLLSNTDIFRLLPDFRLLPIIIHNDLMSKKNEQK